MFQRKLILATAILSVTILPALAGNSEEYSPYLDYDFPNQVFFGDTHLKTLYRRN